MNSEPDSFDLVIVGSGGGSMCAALVAHSLGKKALILEKTQYIGGTTARSGGAMWIPNNRFMRDDGLSDSIDLAATYLDHVVGDQADTQGATRERRLAYIQQAPEMLEFLLRQEIKLSRVSYWPDYHDELPGGTDHGRVVVSEPFNTNLLGKHRHQLRPNYVQVPARMEEIMQVPLFNRTWKGKLAVAKIGMRLILSKLTGQHKVGNGAALQGQMFKRALDAGVTFVTSCPVERLLTDDQGRVIGVQARVDGGTRSYFARDGVLVNAGGFARNQAMRDKYQPGTRADWSLVCEGDTGEMIKEMMRLGAAVAQMDEMVGAVVAMPPDERALHAQVMAELSKPHSIVVDQQGHRYLREAQSYQSMGHAIFKRHQQVPAIPSWLIMDSRYVARYMVSENPPWAKLPSHWITKGFIKKAATLEQLAQQCAMDSRTLVRTVERFNELARRGKDEDLQRGERAYDLFYGDPTHGPSPTLGTIEQGPFYAYQFYPGDIGTTGGVVCNVNAQVLREDGSPIPGLYATGNSTASVMGRAYPGGGSCVGPSFVWGYVAARHACSGRGTTIASSTRSPTAAVAPG